jgi:hypothetical protein
MPLQPDQFEALQLLTPVGIPQLLPWMTRAATADVDPLQRQNLRYYSPAGRRWAAPQLRLLRLLPLLLS